MKELKLTNSEKVALVDDDIYELIKHFSWHLEPHGYVSAKIRLHNFVMPNDEQGMVIDHINCDKADARRENLRKVTRSLNCRNFGAHKKSTSKYKGVSKDKHGKFCVQFYWNNKRANVGRFDDEIIAALASDQVTRHFIKDDVYLNFPDKDEKIIDIEEFEKKLNSEKEYTSIYIGVHLNGRSGKYHAMVRVGEKTKYLGAFVNDFEAAKHREKYIIENELNLKLNFNGDYSIE